MVVQVVGHLVCRKVFLFADAAMDVGRLVALCLHPEHTVGRGG
jgi:hypothetical protein